MIDGQFSGGQGAATSSGGPVDPDAAYAAALDNAMNAPTPQARAKAVDTLEQLARQRVDAAPASGSAGGQGEPLEGFEAPASALAYTFENAIPPGVEVANAEALGALKAGLREMGVPVEIATGGFAEIAHLQSQGAFDTDAAYDGQVQACRAAMHKVHGENAPAMIRDGLAVVDSAVRAGRISENVAEAIVASPMALTKAAEFRRYGRR